MSFLKMAGSELKDKFGVEESSAYRSIFEAFAGQMFDF